MSEYLKQRQFEKLGIKATATKKDLKNIINEKASTPSKTAKKSGKGIQRVRKKPR